MVCTNIYRINFEIRLSDKCSSESASVIFSRISSIVFLINAKCNIFFR